jgi:hypothetical protein
MAAGTQKEPKVVAWGGLYLSATALMRLEARDKVIALTLTSLLNLPRSLHPL